MMNVSKEQATQALDFVEQVTEHLVAPTGQPRQNITKVGIFQLVQALSQLRLYIDPPETPNEEDNG